MATVGKLQFHGGEDTDNLIVSQCHLLGTSQLSSIVCFGNHEKYTYFLRITPFNIKGSGETLKFNLEGYTPYYLDFNNLVRAGFTDFTLELEWDQSNSEFLTS